MDDPLAGHAKRPAIFLEGDGTLDVDCPYCRSPDQITLYDVFGPLKELSEDYLIIVVSNQSGVARGYYTEDDVEAMNEKVTREVEKRRGGGRIDAFYYCPHLPEEEGVPMQEAEDRHDREGRQGLRGRPCEVVGRRRLPGGRGSR
ncbi:MAG: HAD-IIIA family hydrolase [Candidatus Marsarchaeota archaeon]